MRTISTWRKKTYKALSKISLSGRLLDIGGSEKSGYLKLLSGDHTIDINNIDEEYGCTLNFDLEKTWPLSNELYDGLLAINVLEHIFDFRHVLSESYRVLKPKGKIVIAVPFLITYHPCPHDYWRFTEETLEKILAEAGFADIKITPVGTGLFGAVNNIKYNALSKVAFVWKLNELVAQSLDKIFSRSRLGKNFSPKFYPMGYIVTAHK